VSDDGEPTAGLHLPFQRPTATAVAPFVAAALSAGRTDNGRSGERDYHPGYWAAYAFDADAINDADVKLVMISAVGRAGRSPIERYSSFV
jgi:hypothetical protein